MESLHHEGYHQKLAQELSPMLSQKAITITIQGFRIPSPEQQSKIKARGSQFVRAISTTMSTEPTETAEATIRATTMAMVYAMMHCVEYAAGTGRSTTDCAAQGVTAVQWSATPTTMQWLMTMRVAAGGGSFLVCTTAKMPRRSEVDSTLLFLRA